MKIPTTAGEQAYRHINIATFVLLAAFCAIAYANSLHNSFHFDDLEWIVPNPMIRDLKKIPSYFTDIRMSSAASGKDFRPILLVSFALNYAATGLDAAGFRIGNLLIHLGASWLLFLVAAEIFRRYPIRLAGDAIFPAGAAALLAASLFAVHTANSEAVDYIWARSASLAGLFYLSAFYCFLNGPLGGEPGKTRLWHAAGLLFFILGLGTKATIVTLPAALLLYEMLLLNGGQEPLTLFFREPKRLKKYIPIFLVFLAYVIFRFIFLRGLFTRMVAANRPEEIPVPVYLLTQFRAWIYYLKLFIWPHPLITDYPGFGLSHSIWEPRVLLALAIIAALLFLAWRIRKSEPVTTFFLGWYFLAHLPESSFIPLSDAVTGYRAYLSYVAAAVLASAWSIKGACWLQARRGAEINSSRLLTKVAAAWCVVLCILVGATIIRNRDWKNEVTLWTDVAAKDPTNARAYANLAVEAMKESDYEKARATLEHATALAPRKSFSYILRGNLNLLLNRPDLALADATEAVQRDPRNSTAYYLRGEIYRKLGVQDKAIADYRSAIRFLPFFTDAYMGMALAHMDRGELDQAKQACSRITEIDRRDARGYNCLGIILLEQKTIQDALRAYQRGIINVPNDSGLWYGLGLAYQENGMYREASDAFDRSSRLAK